MILKLENGVAKGMIILKQECPMALYIFGESNKSESFEVSEPKIAKRKRKLKKHFLKNFLKCKG